MRSWLRRVFTAFRNEFSSVGGSAATGTDGTNCLRPVCVPVGTGGVAADTGRDLAIVGAQKDAGRTPSMAERVEAGGDSSTLTGTKAGDRIRTGDFQLGKTE